MSWYSKYKGRSIGRILHFLYHYTNVDIAGRATISNGTILYCGEVIATYEWEGETDMPVFKFANDFFNKNQESRKEEAIADGKEYT